VEFLSSCNIWKIFFTELNSWRARSNLCFNIHSLSSPAPHLLIKFDPGVDGVIWCWIPEGRTLHN
jgi:hypothetical protein